MNAFVRREDGLLIITERTQAATSVIAGSAGDETPIGVYFTWHLLRQVTMWETSVAFTLLPDAGANQPTVTA